MSLKHPQWTLLALRMPHIQEEKPTQVQGSTIRFCLGYEAIESVSFIFSSLVFLKSFYIISNLGSLKGGKIKNH